MDNIRDKSQNNLNLNNNIQNNINSFQSQNNFNDINTYFQFQSLNNNQFMNNYPQNYNNMNNNNNNNYYNPNGQEIFNNDKIKNKYQINVPLPSHNDYFSFNNQNNEQDKKNTNKGTQKRVNYMPKNLLLNQQFQNNPNINNLNNNYPMPFPNMNLYNQSINPIYNPEFINENKQNINYNNYNDIDTNFRNIITEIKEEEKEDNKINEKSTKYNFYSTYTYTFDGSLEEVTEVLTNENFFRKIVPSDIIDNVNFETNAFKSQKDSIISLRWKKFYNIKLKCSKQNWSKSSLSFTLTTLESKPADIGSFEMKIKYCFNTCQNKTLFIIELFLGKGILAGAFKEEFLTCEMDEVCSYCSKYLRERKKEKSHVSSLIINTSKEKVWDNINDLNKTRYINYMNKYNLYYVTKDELKNINKENDEVNPNMINNKNNKDLKIQKGDAIIIKNNNNEILSKLEVDEIKEEKNINEIIFVCNKPEKQEKCESKDNDKKCNGDDEDTEILNQKIILSIRDIIKDTCYIEYKHIWQDWVTIGRINNLELFKIKSLNNLQTLLMKSMNEKEINEEDKDTSVISLFNLLCPTIL